MPRLFRRRSSSRRLNRRILVAMLAVALLPVVALTALVGIDLASVNQTAIDEAHRTIVADAEQRESSAVSGGASRIDATLAGLSEDLAAVASAVDGQLRGVTPAARPVAVLAGTDGVRAEPLSGTVVTLFGSRTPLAAASATVVPDPLGSAGAVVATSLDAAARRHPSATSVWLYDANADELVLAATNSASTAVSAIQAGRVDPRHLLDQAVGAALSGGPGPTAPSLGTPARPLVSPAWSDISPALFGTGQSVTVWTPVGQTPGRYVGAELPEAALAALLTQPVSSFPDAYPMLLSQTGRWLAADAGAVHDFGLPQSYLGSRLSQAPVSPLTLPAGSSGVVDVTLSGQAKEVVAVPVPDVHWTLATVLPARDLAPGAESLADGIRSGFRRILIQVLPLAVVLCAIAVVLAYLFSRRLVGPVRALTVSAERLAQGHTEEPVPLQGNDEVGMLSEALERMRREVNASRDGILAAARELEGRVAERTLQLRERNEELVALNELAGSLTRTLDPSTLLGEAIGALGAFLPLSAARGYVRGAGALQRLTDWSRTGAPPSAVADLDEVASAALGSRELVVRSTAPATLIGIPLATAEGPLGAIAVVTSPDWRLAGRTRGLIRAVADQVALALRTAELFAEGREVAVLGERTRLAREIHDTLAQQLTGIVLQLEAAEAFVGRDRDAAHAVVVAARDQARSALQEARRSVWDLRPAPLEATGLVAAAEREVQRWEERTGTAVSLHTRNLASPLGIEPQAEVALFRILQEALSNIAQHARASSVEVTIVQRRGLLELSIGDDGVGLPEVSGDRPDAFGLVGMRERARLAGADLRLERRAGGGTRVVVRLPLPETAPVAAAMA